MIDQVGSKILQFGHDHIQKHAFNLKYGHGIDVIDQDYDNLIILDACRYDIFNNTNHIQGNLTEVTSLASHSEEFIQKCFYQKDLSDTIYISANPFAEQIESDTFYKIIKSYDEDYTEDCQYELHQSRHPGTLCNIARRVYDQHKNKRIVIHFMQPHSPYFGDQAEKLRRKIEQETNKGEDYWIGGLMIAAREGYISREELVNLYTENLKFVLKYVERILDELDGKSIVTSDHGEMLGNPSGLFLPKKYQHKREYYVPELRKVPFLEINSTTRRDIISEEPMSVQESNRDVVDEQLKALGYR
jgi:hypothetical protein